MKHKLFFFLLLGVFHCAAGRSVQSDAAARNTNSGRPENMIFVNTPASTFYMDPYEQSKLQPGDFFSVPNRIPRASIARSEAALKCKNQGKRLCSLGEWQNACLGIHRRQYSYANRAESGRCNTSGARAEMSGFKDGCKSDGDLYDMLGNLMEWVSDDSNGRAIAAGGSFASGDATDCFTAYYFPDDTRSDQIGFRCCQ